MSASAARKHEPDEAQPPQSRGGGRVRPLVLIVDDSLDTREMYATYMRFRGYDVITATNGDEAVDTAVGSNPDLIVMDLVMPRMNGVSATHHIKKNPRTRRIPIVLLTALGHRALEHGALEMGADAFLTKPCLPEDLEVHVSALLDRRRASRS